MTSPLPQVPVFSQPDHFQRQRYRGRAHRQPGHTDRLGHQMETFVFQTSRQRSVEKSEVRGEGRRFSSSSVHGLPGQEPGQDSPPAPPSLASCTRHDRTRAFVREGQQRRALAKCPSAPCLSGNMVGGGGGEVESQVMVMEVVVVKVVEVVVALVLFLVFVVLGFGGGGTNGEHGANYGCGAGGRPDCELRWKCGWRGGFGGE